MWLELTDSLGKRIVVNMALVVSLKETATGTTILETTTSSSGVLHAVVVREGLDEVLRLMEGHAAGIERFGTMRHGGANGSDFVSDGNEG